MKERILSLLKKEFAQILRNKRIRFVILFPPMLQLIVFGYAAVIDVKEISTAVCDRDNTPASREVIEQLKMSDYFHLTCLETDEKRLARLMDSGRVSAIVEIPSGFERTMKKGGTAAVRIAADGTNSVAASVIVSYSGSIIQNYGASFMARQSRLPFKGMVLQLEQRAVYNPSLENRFFYIPGVIAMIVIIVGMNLTAMSIVREKEQGTLEQLIVTPLKPFELILGKILPFVLISLVIITGQILIARYWFQIPLRGDLPTLYLGILLFLLTALGLGIFISTISQTQQQAMLTGFFLVMPSILLSGFMFPISNMPPPVQLLTYLNPLRYLLVILRGIFLKGIGLDLLWPDYLFLAAMGAAIFTLSALRFHKRLG